MINVGIIDPDPIIRATVRMLLTNQNQHSITIAFELGKLPDASLANDFVSPHLILLDLKGHNSKLIKTAKSIFPKTSVLVLSDFWSLDLVYEALRNGAVSYLRKATCLNNILSAVVATYNGGSVLSPCISRE